MCRMRVFPVVSLIAVLAAAACGGRDAGPDHQAEWQDVLKRKQAAASPDAPAEQKQVYADSLRAFVQKHPNHGRAREVWMRVQLEFADDLAQLGRNQDAIRVYRAVLTHDPANEHAPPFGLMIGLHFAIAAAARGDGNHDRKKRENSHFTQLSTTLASLTV